MFTGIIEKIGTIRRLETRQSRLFIGVEVDDFTGDLIPGSSIAVDGACLTATELRPGGFDVDAVKETLNRTTIPGYRIGRKVNLEKAVRLSDRLDGHLVQGHVDGTGTLIRKQVTAGNVLLTFRLQQDLVQGVVPKGSIAIDGVSLTVAEVQGVNVTVTIVPFTLEHTTLNSRKNGDTVNIETDIIGKYVARFSGRDDNSKNMSQYM